MTADGRAAVFLDRDGTLTHPRHYPSRPADLVLYDDVVPFLLRLQRRGVLLIVVTNQSGIARGLFSEHEFEAAQASVDQRLAGLGVRLDGVYHCPHHLEGSVPALSVRCSCRKPEPGMLMRAAAQHGVDLRRSWMIGDAPTDVEAGHRAGCRCILVHRAQDVDAAAASGGSLVAASTAEALGHVLRMLEAEGEVVAAVRRTALAPGEAGLAPGTTEGLG
ncbi:MAG: HAD family hydrolase [Actinobacteria bacterium]|nr:HAD family hydrolase [Actinomycetota bacterium]